MPDNHRPLQARGRAHLSDGKNPWARGLRRELPVARDVRGDMGARADDGRHAETSRGASRRHALPLTLTGWLGSVGYKRTNVRR